MLREVDTLANLRAIVAKGRLAARTGSRLPHRVGDVERRHGSVAGVPARSTPVSDPTAVIPGRLFAGPALAQPADATAAEDNAVVLALGTDDDDRMARLRAYEATSLCSSALPHWVWRAVQSPNRSRSPKREMKSARPCSVTPGFRRCCFGSVGHRSMPILFRRARVARSQTS